MNTALKYDQKINKNPLSDRISLSNFKKEDQIHTLDKNINVFIKKKNRIKISQSTEEINKNTSLNKKDQIPNKLSTISEKESIEKNNFLVNEFMKWPNSDKNKSTTKTKKDQHIQKKLKYWI